MKKEDLIKLAEIAGHATQVMEAGIWLQNWQPDKDIAQAFEVLDSYVNNFVSSHSDMGFVCNIYATQNSRKQIAEGRGKTRPEAICQAVLKAQGEV